MKIGVAGAGTMGIGIAINALISNSNVVLFDTNENSLSKSKEIILSNLNKLIEKGKIPSDFIQNEFSNLVFSSNLSDFENSDLIIEAIIEDFDIKKNLFCEIEKIVSQNCIIATNTSSLSVSSLAGTLKNNNRFLGLHFFNPANIMKLVEIVPTNSTSIEIKDYCIDLMKKWGKLPVITKDTPGFIVNRVARPFYSEALRIFEEGIANFETIDYAMKSKGGFKMGPFELMDFIGNDINYKVTEKVWEQMYFDSRFTPSITQKRLVESGNLGKKTGKGYYDYKNEFPKNIVQDDELLDYIFNRIITMLINLAIDTYYLNIASKDDIDLAVTSGVNYPKGLLKWADALGIEKIWLRINELFDDYKEERYRPSKLLKKMYLNGETFY